MRHQISVASIAAFLLATLGYRSPAIDLTPRFLTTFNEEVAINRPYFTDSGKKYAITLDGESELVPDEGGALFKFTKFPSAVAKLINSPAQEIAPFDDKSLRDYESLARRMLARDAINPVLDSTELNVTPINGWKTCRFTYSYENPAIKLRQSVTFLNLDDKQQIVIDIKTKREEFDNITARTWDMIRRWHEVRDDAGGASVN
jgi:hypothetical protein